MPSLSRLDFHKTQGDIVAFPPNFHCFHSISDVFCLPSSVAFYSSWEIGRTEEVKSFPHTVFLTGCPHRCHIDKGFVGLQACGSNPSEMHPPHGISSYLFCIYRVPGKSPPRINILYCRGGRILPVGLGTKLTWDNQQEKKCKVLLRAHGGWIMKLGPKEMTKAGRFYTF